MKRAQAQHQHNAFYSPKFQLQLKYTTTPCKWSRNSPTFRFWGECEKRPIHIYKVKRGTENPQIVDCAFDYLGLIGRKVAAVRP